MRESGDLELIAVVGIAGRYPGASNVAELWRLLADGRSAVSAIPAHRWDHDRFYAAAPDAHHTNSRWGGLLPGVDRFDPLFFQIAPRDAVQMDPQQRLFLEVAYEAVQDAGYHKGSLSRGTGVYVGVMSHDYGTYSAAAALTGDAPYPYAESYQVANRTSYFLDLTGPSLAVDTACSSSGVALALACDAVRSGTVPMAIAGGVNLLLHPVRFVQYTQMGMLSPRGRCHAFGAEADGIVLGEGAGAVVLKSLATALADRDHIHGVIRGWRVNSGGRTNGFTVPSPIAQAELVRDALVHAGCASSTIGYVEAHGTGTALGDPIEIRGLTKAFGPTRSGSRACAVGSIKTNIGHLESAAAIAGLTKVLLQMRHGVIAPSLYAEPSNPHIDFNAGPFYVPTRPIPYPSGSPRRAGISSFGAGGVNVHLVVEEPPIVPTVRKGRSDVELIAVSAPDAPSLARYALLLHDALRENPADLADVGHTLRTGRDAWPVRAAFVATDQDSLLAGLRSVADGSGPARVRPDRDRELWDLAARWVDGETHDWEVVLPQGQARRVPLPTCPYRRTRHWLPDTTIPGPRTHDTAPVPWLLSAVDAARLRAKANALFATMGDGTGFDPVETGFSLLTDHGDGPHRAVVFGADRAEFASGLRAVVDGTSQDTVVCGEAADGGLAFLFPGQGAQRAGMGRELYTRFPVFARAVEEVCAHLETELDAPVREVLFSEPGSAYAELLDQTMFTQAGLFAIEVALFRLLEAWGLRPRCLLGHSLGELTAAHLAGVFSLPDACRLVAARGRLMQQLPSGGTMVAVRAGIDEVLPMLVGKEDRVAVAAVNGPSSLVLSGVESDVADVVADLTRAGRTIRRLAVSHAYHSPLMEPMLGRFEQVATEVFYHAPQIPVVSNVSGRLATAHEMCEPGYWVRHVRQTVRFHDGLRCLTNQGVSRMMELGPGGVLTAMARESLGSEHLVVSALRRGRPEPRALLAALAQLYVAGSGPRWDSVFADLCSRRPGPGPANARVQPVPRAASGRRYRPVWRSISDPVVPAPGRTVLVVYPAHAGGRRLARSCVHGLAAAGTGVAELAFDPGADRAVISRQLDGYAPSVVLSLLAMDDATPATAHLTHTVTLLRALDTVPGETRLWCATQGATTAGSNPPGDPRQAPLWGLARTAAVEHPKRWGGMVDLPRVLSPQVLLRLAGILTDARGEDECAIRPDGMYVRRLVAADPEGESADPWRPHGTVLITGGTGALGAHVARWSAQAGAEHLVLVSRRGREAPGVIELTAELESLGTTVTVAGCDVADRAALAELLAALPPTPALTAVIHAAGMFEPCLLDDINESHLDRTLRPKMTGLVNLYELTREKGLSAFISYSSISGVCGGREYGAYAAANAFLDAFTEWGRAAGVPMTSVAWGPWAGDGMGGDPRTRNGMARAGWSPMRPETAIEELSRVVGLPEPTFVVADADWSHYAATLAALRPLPLISELVETRTAEVPTTDPSTLARRLLALPEVERQRMVRDMVRTQTGAVLGHPDPSAIATEMAFRDLGFDSLSATELGNRLNAMTGLRLPATVVFDHPTPDALAARLRDDLFAIHHDGFGQTGPTTEIDAMDAEDLVRLALRADQT